MPNGYDGSIRINTEITVKNAEKELGRLRSRMREMKDAKIPTEPYVKLQKEAGQASLKLAKLKALQDSLKKSGNMFSGQWKALSEQSAEAITNIRNIKAEMRELERSGKSMQIIPAAEHDKIHIEALTSEIGRAQEQFDRLIARGNRMKELGQDSGETWDKFQKELQNAATQIYNAQTRLDDFRKGMRTVEVPTEEYGELQKHLREWQDHFRNVKTEQESLRESGKQFSAEWLRTAKNIQAARAELHGIQNVMSGMEGKGTAFLSGDKTEAFAKMAERAAVLEDKIAAGNAKLGQMYTRQKSVSASFGQIGKMAERLRFALAGIGKAGSTAFTALKNTASRAFLGINKEVKKSSGLFSTFASRLKGITLSLLIFNWITKAFNAMVSGMKQGFTNLMDYSSGFADEVQSIKNALSTLGNQFAAAFAPVVQMVIPWLRELIGMLTTAATYASMFFSLLAGKNTFTRAKQVQDSYNKSLDGTAAFAKKAYGALARFDDLDVLQKREDETAGSAGSGVTKPEDMFEEVPIDSGMMDFFDRIKDLLSVFFRPLKEAWDKEGQFVMDSWKYALDEVWNLIKDIGRDFLTVWNQERTIQMFEDILHIIGDIGLVIGNLAHNLDEAWSKNQTGLHILENIRDLFAVIIEHIRNAADATVIWSKYLDFSPLLEAFERFTEALYPAVDAVSGILEDFYTDVLLPFGKWTLEKGLPELLDVFTGFLEKVDWEALRSNLKDFWEHLEPFAENVGEGLIIFLERVSDLVVGFLNSETVMDFLDKLKEWMDSVTPEDVANGIQHLAEAFIGFKVALAGVNIVVSASKLISFLADLKTIVGGTSTAAAEGGAALEGLGTAGTIANAGLLGLGAGIGVLEEANRVWEGAFGVDKIKNAQDLQQQLAYLGNQCADGKISFSEFCEGVDAANKAAEELGFGLDENVIQRFKDLEAKSQDMEAIGEAIANGLYDGVNTKLEERQGETKSFFERWIENTKEVLGVHSPSTVFREIGVNVIEGLLQGLEETWGNVLEFFQPLLEDIALLFSEGWTGIQETAVTVWTGIQEWFAEYWTLFTENLSVVWENIVAFFTEKWEDIQLLFQNFMDFLMAVFAPAWETTWNTAGEIMNLFHTLTDTVCSAIRTLFTGFFTFVRQLVSGEWKGAWETGKEVFNAFRDKVSEIVNVIRGILDSFFGWVSEMVSSILSSISSIGTAIAGAASSFGNFASGISSKIGGVLKIAASGVQTQLRQPMDIPDSYKGFRTVQTQGAAVMDVPSNTVRDLGIPNLAGDVVSSSNLVRNVIASHSGMQSGGRFQIDTMQTAFENALDRSGLGGFGGASLHIHLDYNGEEFARVSLPDFLSEMRRQGYDVAALGCT